MQTNNIEMHKKYRTRSGLPVRVLCVDRKTSNCESIVALVQLSDDNEAIWFYQPDGKYFSEPSNDDLVEVSEWDDFKVDDKVLVSEDGKTWYNRYFNKVIEGVPYAFDGGVTSWTADAMHDYGCSSPWKFCKKAQV